MASGGSELWLPLWPCKVKKPQHHYASAFACSLSSPNFCSHTEIAKKPAGPTWRMSNEMHLLWGWHICACFRPCLECPDL